MKMKRNRNWDIGGVDRISELPESIIHQIMSLLSSKEVAQTCVLSKTWYHLKRNYPVLDFILLSPSDDYLNKLISGQPIRDQDPYDSNLNKIRPAVNDSLQHFSSNKLALQTFSLKNVILGQPNLSEDLDRWIRLAIENGAKELILCLQKPIINGLPGAVSLYTLPPQVSSCKTLTTLDLTSCVLDMPISIFSSLRKLALSECILNGSISLKDSDCPALEEFSVNRCKGKDFKSIYIPSLLRLHNVMVNVDTDRKNEFITVEILSQSIQSLALLSGYYRPWSDIKIQGCDRLKSLYLSSSTITEAELHSLLLKFPLLEELYLFNCSSLKMIIISSLQLKTLEICYDLTDNSCKLIEVSAPNLENFIYKSFMFGTAFGKSVIKVADCCRRSLKTLVLYGHLVVDEVFYKLVSGFPLLENIWIIGCSLLQNIKVPNLQLKRLYIVSCSGLKDVEVSSPNLREFYCSSRKLPKFSVGDVVCASGVRCRRSSINFCFLRLKELLKPFVHVKDGYVLDDVVNVGKPLKF